MINFALEKSLHDRGPDGLTVTSHVRPPLFSSREEAVENSLHDRRPDGLLIIFDQLIPV